MQIDLFKNNLILKLCFEFSLSKINYCSQLDQNRQFVISNQLLKAATSIGANAMEAQNAESKADLFIKLK